RIGAGIRELRDLAARPPEPRSSPARIRRPGGGRKAKRDTDPTLLDDLEALVEPLTRGDPMSPLRWTCKSLAKLAAALRAPGHDAPAANPGGCGCMTSPISNWGR